MFLVIMFLALCFCNHIISHAFCRDKIGYMTCCSRLGQRDNIAREYS